MVVVGKGGVQVGFGRAHVSGDLRDRRVGSGDRVKGPAKCQRQRQRLALFRRQRVVFAVAGGGSGGRLAQTRAGTQNCPGPTGGRGRRTPLGLLPGDIQAKVNPYGKHVSFPM